MTNQILPADLDRMERVLARFERNQNTWNPGHDHALVAYGDGDHLRLSDARALIAAVRAAQRPEADKPKCPTCGGSRFVVVGSPVAGNISAHNEPCPTCVSPTDKLRKAHGTLVDVEDLPPHLQEILRDPKKPELPGCPVCGKAPTKHDANRFERAYYWCGDADHTVSVQADTLHEAVALWKKAAGGGWRAP